MAVVRIKPGPLSAEPCALQIATTIKKSCETSINKREVTSVRKVIQSWQRSSERLSGKLSAEAVKTAFMNIHFLPFRAGSEKLSARI